MPATQRTTLRPGLLVSLKTGVSGGISYFRKDIENAHVTEEGKQKAKWETERVIEDPIEYKAADQTATKAGSLIRKVCSWSAFGLLCPDNKTDELDAAVTEARGMADAFNATANLTRVHVYVMVGRIAADDAEAAKAINSEVRQLMAEMENGISNVDVKKIRDAAYRAKQLGAMLQPGASEKLQQAIETARTAARKIVKAGEQAAQTIDREAIKSITAARSAFLDLDDEVSEVKAPLAKGTALDLEATEVVPEKPNGKATRELEPLPLETAIAEAKAKGKKARKPRPSRSKKAKALATA